MMGRAIRKAGSMQRISKHFSKGTKECLVLLEDADGYEPAS